VLEGRREIDHALPANIINPDVIAHELNPDDPDAVERKAGEAAIKARDVAFANREDFGIETTLTGFGVRKLIANAELKGYEVTMTYVCVSDVEIAVQRVQRRAIREHRTVLPDVVRRRYPASLEALSKVEPVLARIDVYDNSSETLQFISRLELGRVVSIATDVPLWVEQALSAPLAVARDRDSIAKEAEAFLTARTLTARIVEEDMRNQEIQGEVIASSALHAAIATSATSFVIVDRASLDLAQAKAQDISTELRTDVVEPLQPPPRRRRL
jgi:predicted ABC-type ATPase